MRDARSTKHSLNDETVDTIAREASVDPRTVVRVLAGLPVRGLAGERAVAAVDRFRDAQGTKVAS